MNSDYRNQEGYSDPTAGAVLSKVDNSRRQRGRNPHVYRPLVYICSRTAGDVAANTRETRKYCRYAVEQDAIPVAPHLLYPQFMDDENPQEHALGMFFGSVLMDHCAELWIFSDGAYTQGMNAAFKHAYRRRMIIRLFTQDCREFSRYVPAKAQHSVWEEP